jgi:hypothetical protein
MLPNCSKCKTKNGLINYIFTNGISAFKNIWKAIIGSFGMSGLSSKMMGLKEKEIQQKKKFGLVPSIIFAFFGSFVLYNKNDPYKKQFEKDRMLFIAKELVLYHLLKLLS